MAFKKNFVQYREISSVFWHKYLWTKSQYIAFIIQSYRNIIKKKYHLRCATCGSEEGKPHLHWSATKTKLQKSHIDPRQPLIAGNIIPQCQKCNHGNRNRWVYDEKGRVIKVANPEVIKTCDKEIRLKIYKILYDEFNGQDPSKIRQEAKHSRPLDRL